MINPIEADESPMDDDSIFQCACGDDSCKGHNDDPANIRIGSAWYAADCQMANAHPIVVAEREFDDLMNKARR